MKLLLFFIWMCAPALAFCQHSISGKVLTEKRTPLQGASVFIPNTTDGVSTNDKGEFIFAGIAPGNHKIVISHVGYQTSAIAITGLNTDSAVVVILRPDVKALDPVTLNGYDKKGWRNWGTIFTAAFIGTSAYAEQCVITNKAAVNFTYSASTNLLHAYAAEPLLIENNALGYTISVELADFAYNTETKNVDYQLYSFFKEMHGTAEDQAKWKENREAVYKLSLMHFMRALYANNTAKEGFEIRWLEKKKNDEKARVQGLYQQRFVAVRDSLGKSEAKEITINKLIEKSFTRDSLRYYRRILEQDDRTDKLHPKPISSNLIASRADSNTVLFQFKDYLHVTYKKVKEPGEYMVLKNEMAATLGGYKVNQNTTDNFPISELLLQQGIPVEVNENGYFSNVDLYMNGFWGWWEKMATKLPYGYKPG